MLCAYMDDSGSHPDSAICLLAGYWGHVKQWQKLEKRWKSILVRFNVKEFHAQRFWARGPNGRRFDDYRDWSGEKAREFMDSLLSTIEACTIYPFACGVAVGEWKKKSLAERRVFTGASDRNPTGAPKKSIFLPFQMCVMQISTYCTQYFPLGTTVHFVMDDDPGTTPWASICYSQLKNIRLANDPTRINERMGDLIFADSKTIVPLQAADLLAYEANLFSRAATENPKVKMRQVYRRALKRARSIQDFQLFDERRFESLDRFLKNALTESPPSF